MNARRKPNKKTILINIKTKVMSDFFLFRWIKKLGDAIGRIFSTIEKEWHELEPDLKNALQSASGIVAVINENLQATPQFLLELIHHELPNLDIEKAKAAIAEVAKTVKDIEVLPDEDITVTLDNLQKYFNSLQGEKWAITASQFAQQLALLLAPEGTPFGKILVFLEFVYRRFYSK